MLPLKKTEDRFTANKSQPQAVTMWEKSTRPMTGSLVRDGRTHSRMITVSPMWEITTSVGIPMGPLNPRSGATPLTMIMSARIAQFHFAPL